IAEGSFFRNATLCRAADAAAGEGRALHLIGLLSPGGIHSHEDHIEAMIDLAIERGCRRIYLHALLDGRDMPPRSARPSLEKFEAKLREAGVGHIASVAGRYYGMDRDKRWDRVKQSFDAICCGEAPHHFADAVAVLDAAYARGENDEFVQPSAIHAPDEAPVALGEGDAVVFMTFRADRARALAPAFVDKDVEGFERPRLPSLSTFVMLTEYEAGLEADCAYPPESLTNGFGEYLANEGRTQLRIAET